MARKGGEAMAKRRRELARQEKQALKQEKREARAEEPTPEPVDEGALMEQFARLSERFASDQITEADYNEERIRIFSELGIESDSS